MVCKDISFPQPEYNLVYDDVLLYRAEHDNAGEVLRFWEAQQPFIVLGRICKEQDDLQIPEILKDEIPVLRRSSGGGTVVQGPGCLNFTLVLRKDRHPDLNDIGRSYQYILTRVIEALSRLNVAAEFHPVCDIALVNGKKKISGNAQKRGRQFIMHHGTILYDFDIHLAEKYLQMPKDIPDYRKARPHRDFIANATISVEAFKQSLCDGYGVKGRESQISFDEEKKLQEFLAEHQLPVDIQA